MLSGGIIDAHKETGFAAFDGGAFPQDNWRMDSSSSTGAQTSEKAALYLGVCAAVLVVALVFAKVYPFHKRLR